MNFIIDRMWVLIIIKNYFGIVVYRLTNYPVFINRVERSNILYQNLIHKQTKHNGQKINHHNEPSQTHHNPRSSCLNLASQKKPGSDQLYHQPCKPYHKYHFQKWSRLVLLWVTKHMHWSLIIFTINCEKQLHGRPKCIAKYFQVLGNWPWETQSQS